MVVLRSRSIRVNVLDRAEVMQKGLRRQHMIGRLASSLAAALMGGLFLNSLLVRTRLR